MMDKRERVLLVASDYAVCHGVRNVLKNNVYDMDFAHNVRDALSIIQSNSADLVLFDGDSVGISISEFVSLIKDSAGGTPGIVAIINRTDADNGSDYIPLAVDDLIIKPLDSTELQYRIHRVLKQRNSLRVFNKGMVDLEALLEVSKTASSPLSSKEILHTMVKRVATLMDLDRCSISRVTRTEKFAQIIASHDNPNIQLEIMLDNYPEIKKVLESGETVIVRHILHNPLMKDVQENVTFLKDKTIVVIPIVLKEHIIGVLFLRSIRGDKFFDERGLKYLKVIAFIAANVLNNAFLYENLEFTKLQLIQSERFRTGSELATGAVHNFNNVLSGILGHIQMLLSWDVDAAMYERLQIIEKLVLDGSEIVKRVQGFTGICSLKDFTTMNINDIVNDVVRMTEPKWSAGLHDTGITLRVDVDAKEPPVVEGNASELREVFVNILFNAVDAMPNGGEITIRTSTNGKDVFACFTDTGKGMSKETKNRVFDPFFTTKGSKGMGLGMSVAYGIIKRHNGQITIDSEIGIGTTVTVQIPISQKISEEKENNSYLKRDGKTEVFLTGKNGVISDVLAENLIN